MDIHLKVGTLSLIPRTCTMTGPGIIIRERLRPLKHKELKLLAIQGSTGQEHALQYDDLKLHPSDILRHRDY